MVAAASTWWHLPVEHWLPGALSLFFIPYFGTLVICAWLLLRAWRLSSALEKLLVFVLLLVGPYTGILLSLPFVCGIVKECL